MLDAPGSSCVVGGLYFTYGTQHIDNHVVIDHLKPHTRSDLYFKGILDDRSRAVFSGGVIVHPNAQKSEAYQKDQNLLLSQGARINTKPMLEIYADDIQATHGATAGAVADEAIFYMRSRGIDEKTARDLLVHGFAKEIIDRVPWRRSVNISTACSPTGCPASARRTNRKVRVAVLDLEELYQEIVLEHNRRPRNFRKMDDPTCTSHGFNPFCGDTITLYMTLDDDNTVTDVSFEAAGCAISKASASMMTQAIKGKTVDEAQATFGKFHDLVTNGADGEDDESLGDLVVLAGVRSFPTRIKCATLSWHALRGALEGEETVSTE